MNLCQSCSEEMITILKNLGYNIREEDSGY
jgi:hypothetical protein